MIFEEKARVISNFEIGDKYYEMILEAPRIAKAALPGQFVMVRVSQGLYPFLRRPFSIAGKDFKTIKLLYKAVGIGTRMLSQIPPGEFLDITGPLGNGFNLKLKGNILLVAGGIGIAPLLFLIQELVSLNPKNRKRIWLLFGEKTSELIDYVGENFVTRENSLLVDHLELITEDENTIYIRKKGFVTDLLLEKMIHHPFKFSQVFACGPTEMLRSVAKIIPGRIPCWVSVESRMACGLGDCRGCVIPLIYYNTKKADREIIYETVCEDGPVFEIHKIFWQGWQMEEKKVTVKGKRKLSINLAGRIKMKNPVMNASGTFDENFFELVNPRILGAIVTKTVTLKQRLGNSTPRIQEVDGGLINWIGLENKGVGYLIEKTIPNLKKYKVPIIVSIYGQNKEEFVELTQKLNSQPIAALELNLSCPNIGEEILGYHPLAVFEMVSSVKKVTSLPVIAKLPPSLDFSQMINVTQIAQNAGADILALVNTFPAATDDLLRGGLSGPPIKPLALRIVHEVAKKVNIPIIGMGGISSLEDALAFFKAGAKAIAIGSANFHDPLIIPKIIKGLQRYS